MTIEYESLMPVEPIKSTQFLYWVEISEVGRGGWGGAAGFITGALAGPQKQMIEE